MFGKKRRAKSIALFGEAFEFARNGEFMRAIASANESVGVQQRYGAYDLIGQCWECIGQFTDAAQAYSRGAGIARDPGLDSAELLRSWPPWRPYEYLNLSSKSARSRLRAKHYDDAIRISTLIIHARVELAPK